MSTTITGKLENLGQANVSTGAFVRFYLRGAGGNQPRVNGTAIIAPTLGNVYYFDFVPNASGVISGTLWSTRDSTGLLGGDIEVGGVTTAVWYGMVVYNNGKAGPETPIHAKNAATIDISNVTPITSNPVVTAPTGDSTYARLDSGNMPFTGAVNGASAAFTGALTAGSYNGAQVANLTSSTCGIAEAIAATGANCGEIIVPAGTCTMTATLTISKNGCYIHGSGNGQSNQNFGPTRLNSAAAVTAFDVPGHSTRMENLHIVSQSTVSGTDDCIRVRGLHFLGVNLTCESFGRDGLRVDSASGATLANLGVLIGFRALSNRGDGIRFVTGSTDVNGWTIIAPYNSNNSDYGFNAETAKDLRITGGTMEGNAVGGWRFDNVQGLFGYGLYCEVSAVSSLVLTANATHNKLWFPSFGQCTTITDSSAGVRGNEIHYKDTTTSEDVVSYLNIGPKFGATTPTIYSFMSGSFGNGWLNLHDVTNNVDLFSYNPGTKIWTFLTPVATQFTGPISPATLGGTDLGTAALPWGHVFIGTGSADVSLTAAPTANRTATFPDATGTVLVSGNNGGPIATKRGVAGCTTGAAAGNSCGTDITVTWTTAFADANYTVSCIGNNPTNVPSAPFIVSGTKLAATVHINYFAITAAAASYATIECTAVHD